MYTGTKWNVHLGSCLDVIPTLPSNSVDSIITDPPYELSFMNNKWDSSGIAFNVDLWKECLRVLKPGGFLLAFGAARTWHRLAVAVEDAGFEIRDSIAWLYGQGFPKSLNIEKATGDSQWAGWGTSLKPSFEPIVMARKPLEGTVADTVQKYGTGGLNIEGTRVGDDVFVINTFDNGAKPWGGASGEAYTSRQQQGRWMGNVAMDESVETSLGDISRFFFVAKANKKDRNEGGVTNTHPTVKPTALMRQLVKLVTPPNGTVLDPFTGSGTTGKAALLEGFHFIGVELTEEYLPIITGRLNDAEARAI